MSVALAKIHIAKKDLAMNDDIYRDCIYSISEGRTTSSKNLSVAETGALLKHFCALGWQPKYKKAGVYYRSAAQGNKSIMKEAPQIYKIKELWRQLHDAGKVHNPSSSALNHYIERQVGSARIEWINGSQASKTIESLKKWLARK